MDRQRRLPAPHANYPTGPNGHSGPTDLGWQEGNGRGPEQEIDWRRWAWVLWRRKWWILAVTVIGTSLSILAARNDEPVYQAQAMVWVDAPDQGGPIEVTSVFSPLGWVDLLRSYAVLDAVVHELRLYLQPEREADRSLFHDFTLLDNTTSGSYRLVVRLDNSYSLLDVEGRPIQVAQPGEPIGEKVGFRWVPPEGRLLPGKEIAFKVRRPRAVADKLGSNLEVLMEDPDEGNFIRLTFQGHGAEHVADVLNAILDHYVQIAAELKREKLTKLAGTLDEQLELAAERLRRAESQLENFRVNTITLPDDRRSLVTGTTGSDGTAFAGGDPVFDRYFSLTVERDRLREERRDLQKILKDMEETGKLDAMRLEAVPAVRTASALMAALEELGRKEVERRTLLYRYTEQHSEVQKITRELEVLENGTIPSLVRQLIDRLATREAELRGQIGAQTAQLQRIPPRAIEESRLRREVALAGELYNSLQFRYKEAQVAEASTQPNVRALDRASPPAAPAQNTARLRVILGFILSLALGVGGVVVHERFVERRLQYPEQVVGDLGLPVLGVVPNLRALQAQPEDAANESPYAQSVIESFRALRTQLTHGLGIEFPAVIAITSPGMGEGKSLVTTNLALAFADPNRPTILIDGDTRRGSLHRVFGLSRSPGLTDYLRGDAENLVVVRPTDTSGLYLVARGPYTEEVPELLDGEGMPTLLEQLKQNFQVILIDTPPLSAGVDGVLIGAHADAVLAVLRTGRTDLELARAKFASYAQMLGVPIVGAILNDVEVEGPYRYYTYSYEVYPYEAT